MAQSPFQTSGNVGDIAPVQLKGGFTPATGIADALVDVANTVIPIITKNLEDDITDDVSGKIQAVSLALKVTRFPSIQSSVFSEEALANPSVQLALAEFTKIQDATKSGRLPGTFALERLELIQNDAIKNAPEFEAEIRGAMRDATGQDPTKALFRQLLSSSTTKTAEQKAFEQLDIQAIKIGKTREQVIGMNQVAAENQMLQNKFDLASKQGTYTLNTLGSEVINRGEVLVTDIMADVLAMNTAGIPIGVEQQNALVAKVNAAFGAANAALLAKTSGLNISGTALSAELKPLMELRDNTINMIEDGTMAKLLKQHSEVIVADAQNTFLNNPEYGRLHAVLGAEGTLKFMEFKTTFGGNKKAEALLRVLNKDAAGLYKADEILRQASRIGDGAEIGTVGVKQARILAAAAGTANSAAGEEYQLASLEDLKKYSGDELAWSNFGSNNMLVATANSNRLKAAFINMQATTTAGLSEDLVQLASDPNVQMERMVMSSAGLTLTPRDAAERVGLAATAAAADASMLTYIRRFNRANNISAKYNGAGVLPAARYQGADMYWNTVRKAADDIVQPKKKANAPRKIIRGADGKLVFDGGT